MTVGLCNLRRRRRLALLVLPVLMLRALIPAGFMPARDAAFSVAICPEGFPTQLLAHAAHHHDHGGGPGHSEHCAFGSTCGAGPLTQSAPCAASPTAPQRVAAPPATPVLLVRLVHLPEARGPPRRLSGSS